VSGQLDWAGNDIPNVYANYVNLNPLTNHAWFAAGSTVTLWFNLNPGNGGATGINDTAVRKAVSYGVDRNALALLGESGYENPATSSSGLILPNQSAFLPADGSMKNDLAIGGSVPDAATAKANNLPAGMDVYDILKSGGWTPPATSSYDSGKGVFKSGGNCDGTNSANCWTKGGTIIKFSVYDPVPFLRLLGKRRAHVTGTPATGHGRDHEAGAGVLRLEHQHHLAAFSVADRHPLGQRRQHPLHPVPELVRQQGRELGCALPGLVERRR